MRLRTSELPGRPPTLPGDKGAWPPIERLLGVTPEEADSIARRQAETGQLFGETAVQMGLVTPEQLRRAIEQQQDFPVLRGDDPRMDPLVVAAFDPEDPISQSVRSLRGTLFADRVPGTPARSLAVIGIGVTTEAVVLTSNLAVACAQAGSRTLLIDAKVDTPSQHILFRVPNRQGLSTFLSKSDVTASEVIQQTAIPSLALLTAGPEVPNAIELLDRARADKRLRSLVELFDVILIDAGESRSTASLLVGEGADSALLVVHQNVSMQRDLRRVGDRLAERGTTVLGTVMAI